MWDQTAAQRFGTGLRMMREAEGLSPKAFAHAAGITKNQVQLLEAGRSSGRSSGGRKEASGPSNPRMSTLAGVAAALGKSVPGLLLRAEELAALTERIAEGLDDYRGEEDDPSWMGTDDRIGSD